MVRVYFYGVGFFLWYKVPERYILSLVLVLVSGGTSSCKTERGYVLPDTYPGATGIDIGTVDTMHAITSLAVHGMLSGLKQELPLYLASSLLPTLLKLLTSRMCKRTQKGSSFPRWALAVRIVFALSPNSATCEHVFSPYSRWSSKCLKTSK